MEYQYHLGCEMPTDMFQHVMFAIGACIVQLVLELMIENALV